MRSSAAILILVTVVSAGICPRGPVDTVAPVLSSERIYYDDAPAFPDSTRQIILDSTAWGDVWSTATSAQPSPPARPGIDFRRNAAVLVSAGRMRPGDVIRVDSAGIRSGVFKIFVRTIEECQDFPGTAYPFEIVRVVRPEEPVDWVEAREQAAHCSARG